MSKKFNYNDDLEKILTAIFGVVGMVAIFISLYLKGFGAENWLDAIKDIAGLIVAIAVFLVANKVLRFNLKSKKYGFNDKFEQYLLEWAVQNKYLIDSSQINIERGNEGKRKIEIITNYENFVSGSQLAVDISSKFKGAFLYLPLKGEIESEKNSIIEFRINKSMFQNKKDFDFETQKIETLDKIANRIHIEFKEYGITSKRSSDLVEVNFKKLEKTDENAKKLIDVVEFVKTLFLAIA